MLLVSKSQCKLKGASLTHLEGVAADEKVMYSAAALQDMVELPSRVISTISCEVNLICQQFYCLK